MNSSNSTDNESYYSIDYWLTTYASTWVFDSIYLFVITPLGILGFISNILCFYILRNKEFENKSIFGYFKVISINSSILCLIQATLFTSLTYRYFPFFNSYEANWYCTVIYLPVSNINLLFGSLMDICLSLERCSIFNISIKALFKPKVYKLSLVLFAISVLIGLPYFFVNIPHYYDWPIGKDQYYRIYSWTVTQFGKTVAGEIITYLILIARDLVFLVAEIVLNIMTLVLFSNYLKNRAKVLDNRTLISTLPTYSNPTNSSHVVSNVGAQQSQGNGKKTDSNKKANVGHGQRFSSQDKSLTVMIIAICFFSIIIHIFYLAANLTLFSNNSYDSSSVGSFVVFLSTFKHFSNILFLYFFNPNFKKVFKNLFKKN